MGVGRIRKHDIRRSRFETGWVIDETCWVFGHQHQMRA